MLLVGWEGRDLVVEHCDTRRRFRVDTKLLALLSGMADWTAAEDLAAGGGPATAEQLAHLVDVGVVERSGGTQPGAAYWSPVDLAVQRRSATGGYREDVVAARVEPAPPAFKRRPDGPLTPLPEPAALGGSVGDALARRRSIRAYADRPLALGELSTLLHHSARVQRVLRHELLGDVALRPFASAGARSELELYVVANDVSGLADGAHYYDARAHCLVHLGDRDAHRQRLNHEVQTAAGGMLSRDPPVIVLVTAVFARVMWKYEDIALGLIYKDTGCLLQTLYLVATAIGLAPCAIGAGQEAVNARWLGLDPMVESQVGCLVVGPAVRGAP